MPVVVQFAWRAALRPAARADIAKYATWFYVTFWQLRVLRAGGPRAMKGKLSHHPFSGCCSTSSE
jgi:hypothetical protein